MSEPAWPDLETLFHEALACSTAEREALLAERCSGQPKLRVQVEAMLRAHDEAPGALDVSAITTHATLESGTRFGGYEIAGRLGAGGMGEVYRARDTKLRRDVAIKILPSAFVADADRTARFEREARVLAALNHPHIAAIYGFEQGALILELVEGETLADRIGRGPIPITETLAIAHQIAEALEASHEKGIVHRDLKPANIKITPEGTVKLLDFGLAKAMSLERASVDRATDPIAASTDTRAGLLLGTAAYMSPEQARGTRLDKRTDIWAFGCVLYEMLTARQALGGETVSDTIAAILEREPDWTVLPDTTPAAIRRLLQRCLEKDPRHRVRDIGDARIELEDVLAGRATGAPVAQHARRERVAWVSLALVTLASALAVGSAFYLRRASADTPAYRSSILPPAGGRLEGLLPSALFALSPDGRRLAFVGNAGGVTQLWVQSLDGLAGQPLAGTESAIMPFWSPDSEAIGFLAGGKVKRIAATGGPPVTLADANPNTGATWNRDGTILFASFGPGNPIRRVSASGGAPSAVTTLSADAGETQHAFPFFLPDGRHFLYLAVGSKTGGPFRPNGIYVTALDSSERKLLVSGGSNVMYAQGYLLFLRAQTLIAQPFDVDRLELTGDATPLAERVATGGRTGTAAGFSVSETGVLAYQTGPAGGALLSQLVWFDRSGKQIGALGDQAPYGDLALTPDGGRLAVSLGVRAGGGRDIWLFDVARGLRTRFTFDAAEESTSVWSPDGSRVVFNSRRKGHLDLYQKASSGAGAEEELLADDFDKYPVDWSPDGRFILFGVYPPRAGELWVLPLFGDRKPFPFLQTKLGEAPGRFSPDGRWVTYASNESGRNEVYVAPFPGPGGKWQVSADGGNWPRWRRDGREIFYLAPGNKLMAVAVNGQGSALEVGTVRALFDTRALPNPILNQRSMYDASPDGQRFLVNTLAEEGRSAHITLVVNWPALLKK